MLGESVFWPLKLPIISLLSQVEHFSLSRAHALVGKNRSWLLLPPKPEDVGSESPSVAHITVLSWKWLLVSGSTSAFSISGHVGGARVALLAFVAMTREASPLLLL